ncbi:MAG: hypothetical protein Q8K94_09900, partial [Moraxellaceae bacterium]|nr:hypothetical protein [Moraxellaceae bacterium]
VSSTNGESRTTQQQYNKDGQLVVTIDARGQSASRAYDQAGRLSSVTDVRGFTTTFAYDAANRVVTKTDALGTITSYVFDGQGRQITVTEAVGKPEARQTDYAYDRKGQLLTVTRDPNGLALRTTYAYDGIGRQVQVSEGTVASPDQRVVAYTFDKLGRRTAEQIDPTGLNLTTQYFYNGNDQVTRTIDAAGNSTWYIYDNAGRLTDTVDALGAVTRNTHDANGNVISTRRFINTVVTTSFGNAITSVNPIANAALDQITTYAYDNLNRLTSTTDALGSVESYTYDKAGNRITLTNKNGATWHYRYDELNRLSEEITPAIQVSSIATNGQVSTQTQLIVTRIEYDAAGNVTSRSEGRLRANLTSAPASDNIIHARTTNYAYDAVGRQILTTSPGWYNKITGAYQFANDGLGNTFRVTTEVTYDALGNAVRNRVRTNNTGTVANDFIDSYKTYDKAGRVVHEIDALNGVTTYSHDAVDNVLTIKRHANALNYAVPASGYYVASDITTARLVPDAANDRTMTMSYDAAGRKTSVQLDVVNVYITGLMLPFQGAPTTLFTYDAMGRVIKETQIVRDNGITLQTGASLHSYYDKVGNQIGSVDALGYLTRNTYDALGQVIRSVEYNNKLSSWSTNLPNNPSAHAKDRSTAYAYDRLGRLTTVTKENVTVWRHNITSGNAYTVAASVLNAVEMTGNLVVDQRTYDNVGNMLTLRDGANNVTTMGYNALGHMTSLIEPARLVAKANQINSFENNIAHAISASPQTVYALNAFGQVISETRTPGANQAGWVTTIKTRYDQAGHEIEHIDAANASTHYKVDAAGRRIELRQQVSAQFAVWTGTSGYNHEI